MGLILTGEVKTIINRVKKDDNTTYARLYQIETVVNSEGYKRLVDVDDFDLKRKVEIGKELALPIYVTIYQPEGTNGKKGNPVLQYHALKSVGNGSEEKKSIKV